MVCSEASCNGDPIGPQRAITSSGVRLATASLVESTAVNELGADFSLVDTRDLIFTAADVI
jgi:hypothetical protein